MSSKEILTKGNVKLNVNVKNKDEAIKAAGQVLVENNYVNPEYIDSMMSREETLSTYMGNYIAIPHGAEGSEKFINKTGISVLTLENEVDFGNGGDYNPVKILFGISGIKDEHLEILSKIALYIMEDGNVEDLIQTDSREEIVRKLEAVNL